MTVPYTTPAESNTTLDSCLAASAFIDQYLGCETLGYQQRELLLTAYQPIDWYYTSSVRLALPNTPVQLLDPPAEPFSEVGLELVHTSLPPAARLPKITYATLASDWWNRTFSFPAITGWPLTDATGLRTFPIGNIVDGDLLTSAVLVDGVTTEPGECWAFWQPGTLTSEWHLETAYVETDGTLYRYATKYGSTGLDNAEGQAQRVRWPADLVQTASTIARRLEQLQRSPGFGGYDTPAVQAVLHQVTRSLDRFREI